MRLIAIAAMIDERNFTSLAVIFTPRPRLQRLDA